jgi:mono/diheme cytochrome c family protein
MGMVLSAGVLLSGCPNDMWEQPSFSYQEAPRRHSPPGSIPQVMSFSHVDSPAASPAETEKGPPGARLFAVNCAHCHGPQGMGDGPVAGYLPEMPTNLQAQVVQQKPDEVLYVMVTHGIDAMPAFEKFLTQEERWAVVSFLRSLNDRTASSNQWTQGPAGMESP